MVMIAKKRNVCLVLDNIRSVHNVGSIFRTAETLGISEIYCLGTTPTPTDRFGNIRKDFVKVSLGAENFMKWKHVGDSVNDHLEEHLEKRAGDGDFKKTKALIISLKKKGFKIIGLEQSSKSIDYKKVRLHQSSKSQNLTSPVAIILGNEVDGVSPKLLKLADMIAEIPMLGRKESLNVSVAAGIFLYRLLDN